MPIGTDSHLNLSLVIGEVVHGATVTEARDGRIYTSFDLVCRCDSGRVVVPVTVEHELSLEEGICVAVVGQVVKRFFPSASGMASRTDLRAREVTVLRRNDQVARVIRRFAAVLGPR